MHSGVTQTSLAAALSSLPLPLLLLSLLELVTATVMVVAVRPAMAKHAMAMRTFSRPEKPLPL